MTVTGVCGLPLPALAALDRAGCGVRLVLPGVFALDPAWLLAPLVAAAAAVIPSMASRLSWCDCLASWCANKVVLALPCVMCSGEGFGKWAAPMLAYAPSPALPPALTTRDVFPAEVGAEAATAAEKALMGRAGREAPAVVARDTPR